MDKLEYKIMDCEADLDNKKRKLKSEIDSTIRDLQYELELLEKEDYKPRNEIGVIHAKGCMIDNLVGQIYGLNKALKSLKSLREE